jgi:hypothetical protein
MIVFLLAIFATFTDWANGLLTAVFGWIAYVVIRRTKK